MPTNIYGPGDNFDLENSHVLPALIRKFHDAKTNGDEVVTLWGSGSPFREFLYADDLASACLFLLEKYDDEVAINVGSGKEISIKDLAELVKKVVGFEGQIRWDASKPDGTPRKLLEVSKLAGLGWSPKVELHQGIRDTYKWYAEQGS
jgi:GDP-L-fucose synthase